MMKGEVQVGPQRLKGFGPRTARRFFVKPSYHREPKDMEGL